MANVVVTLKERHRREMERMARAIAEIDQVLAAYARQHGGRFIRYGSTAKGRMMLHSDVDIIADFEGDAAREAASYAEELCCSHDMIPDVRPSYYASNGLTVRALEEGVILS